MGDGEPPAAAPQAVVGSKASLFAKRARGVLWWLNPFNFGVAAGTFLIYRWLARKPDEGSKLIVFFRVVGAILFAWLFIEVVVVPAIAGRALWLDQRTLGRWPEWIVLVLLAALAARSLSDEIWRLWIPPIKQPEFDATSKVLAAYLCLVMVTLTFTLLTATVVAHRWLGTSAPRGRDSLVWHSLAFYTWNFVDAIPLLKIPQTLHWKREAGFNDHLTGGLLLLYKLLVIVPVTGLIVSLVRRRPTPAR